MGKQQILELFNMARNYAENSLVSNPGETMPLHVFVENPDEGVIVARCQFRDESEKMNVLNAVRALCVAVDAPRIAVASEAWMVTASGDNPPPLDGSLADHPDAISIVTVFAVDRENRSEHELLKIERTEDRVSLEEIPEIKGRLTLTGNLVSLLPEQTFPRQVRIQALQMFNGFIQSMPGQMLRLSKLPLPVMKAVATGPQLN